MGYTNVFACQKWFAVHQYYSIGEARSIIKEKSDIHYKSLYHHRIKLGSACFSIAAVVRMAFLVVC